MFASGGCGSLHFKSFHSTIAFMFVHLRKHFLADPRPKVTSGVLLGGYIFTSALILAFAYTYAQENRGKQVTFIVFKILVQYLPWCMLGLTLVFQGWAAALQEAMGIVAAHLYDFLTRLYPTFQGGRNFIQTPSIVKQWFGAYQQGMTHRGYGTAVRPGQQRPQAGPTRGWASAITDSWSGRGAGRRLGGG